MSRSRCNSRFKGGVGAGKAPAMFWLGRVTKSQAGLTKAEHDARAIPKGDKARFFQEVYKDARR